MGDNSVKINTFTHLQPLQPLMTATSGNTLAMLVLPETPFAFFVHG